ncbi:MAG: hypothetical protein CBC27_11470 [Opitutia bacterium TMED67]|nr:hypothetical protein [Verrucomicrobiales bacterium]OUU68475.1 MAG: hypothetical protein CBC27_11470 [Opitutae bacterium TMED67]RZO54748.1 MAG: DUF229 domain-containing protein [Limisphaerales bacterium]|tara:strand:- start:412 stop:1929 length:1518 start_codon:yes stop_codon:yes gene_type:complete
MRKFIIISIISAIFLQNNNIQAAKSQPNILFCISDDQSYAHTGANGDPVVKTPAFDRIAREGLRFTNAFCDAPTCGPSRSAILTGQPIWRLEEAGNIHSTLPSKFITYTKLLKDAGYNVGYTGKGWSPGRLEPGGRTINPAGTEYKDKRSSTALKNVSQNDYAANFESFLKTTSNTKPFCFWLGTYEPHRGFEKGAGLKSGKDPSKVIVPPIFPNDPIVRSDILDYYMEIEHFDKMVHSAITTLEKNGELDNTIIVVTSDHGMPFPRAKATLYDDGTRVPLAIRWPKGIQNPGRTIKSFVNLSDLAPTFLEASNISPPKMMTAKSLINIFKNNLKNKRTSAFIAMERHDGCRKGGKGFPSRAIRTEDFLYIKNYKPNRWPAGNPDRENCARYIPFGEVDTSPTKTLIMDGRNTQDLKRFYDLAFSKKPAEELYSIKTDPNQMVNLAGSAEFSSAQKEMKKLLENHLVKTGDPRELGLDTNWDYYPYYGVRHNKNWKVDIKPSIKK